MPAIEGFFFDLDGTLVDTYEADYLAYRDAIAEVAGIDITRSEFDKTVGQEMRDKLKLLTPGLSEDQIAQIGQAKKHRLKKYLHLTKKNHTLAAFLEDVSKHHITVLVTTAKQHNAVPVLEAHNLAKYFSHAVYGNDVQQPKPNPQSYLIALEKSGLAANQVIAFEDSQPGMEAAKAAGISVIQVRGWL